MGTDTDHQQPAPTTPSKPEPTPPITPTTPTEPEPTTPISETQTIALPDWLANGNYECNVSTEPDEPWYIGLVVTNEKLKFITDEYEFGSVNEFTFIPDDIEIVTNSESEFSLTIKNHETTSMIFTPIEDKIQLVVEEEVGDFFTMEFSKIDDFSFQIPYIQFNNPVIDTTSYTVSWEKDPDLSVPDNVYIKFELKSTDMYGTEEIVTTKTFDVSSGAVTFDSLETSLQYILCAYLTDDKLYFSDEFEIKADNKHEITDIYLTPTNDSVRISIFTNKDDILEENICDYIYYSLYKDSNDEVIIDSATMSSEEHELKMFDLESETKYKFTAQTESGNCLQEGSFTTYSDDAQYESYLTTWTYYSRNDVELTTDNDGNDCYKLLVYVENAGYKNLQINSIVFYGYNSNWNKIYEEEASVNFTLPPETESVFECIVGKETNNYTNGTSIEDIKEIQLWYLSGIEFY